MEKVVSSHERTNLFLPVPRVFDQLYGPPPPPSKCCAAAVERPLHWPPSRPPFPISSSSFFPSPPPINTFLSPRSTVEGGGGERRWGCFLTKKILLSDENICTLPFDENRLEPCFLTKMRKNSTYFPQFLLNIANNLPNYHYKCIYCMYYAKKY